MRNRTRRPVAFIGLVAALLLATAPAMTMAAATTNMPSRYKKDMRAGFTVPCRAPRISSGVGRRVVRFVRSLDMRLVVPLVRYRCMGESSCRLTQPRPFGLVLVSI